MDRMPDNVSIRDRRYAEISIAKIKVIIRDNLFGLEIDQRCTQIGAFNVALAAWRRVGHCRLPAMNLACSGLAPNAREADWLALAGDNEKHRNGMERLYQLFQKAAVLGESEDDNRRGVGRDSGWDPWM